jgi:hypothetical protein
MCSRLAKASRTGRAAASTIALMRCAAAAASEDQRRRRDEGERLASKLHSLLLTRGTGAPPTASSVSPSSTLSDASPAAASADTRPSGSSERPRKRVWNSTSNTPAGSCAESLIIIVGCRSWHQSTVKSRVCDLQAVVGALSRSAGCATSLAVELSLPGLGLERAEISPLGRGAARGRAFSPKRRFS